MKMMCMMSNPMSLGRTSPNKGIEVGSIIIHQTAIGMNQTTDFADVTLKQANGIGIGKHNSCYFVRKAFFKSSMSTHPSSLVAN
jgi:hypothetical protein